MPIYKHRLVRDIISIDDNTPDYILKEISVDVFEKYKELHPRIVYYLEHGGYSQYIESIFGENPRRKVLEFNEIFCEKYSMFAVYNDDPLNNYLGGYTGHVSTGKKLYDEICDFVQIIDKWVSCVSVDFKEVFEAYFKDLGDLHYPRYIFDDIQDKRFEDHRDFVASVVMHYSTGVDYLRFSNIFNIDLEDYLDSDTDDSDDDSDTDTGSDYEFRCYYPDRDCNHAACYAILSEKIAARDLVDSNVASSNLDDIDTEVETPKVNRTE